MASELTVTEYDATHLRVRIRFKPIFQIYDSNTGRVVVEMDNEADGRKVFEEIRKAACLEPDESGYIGLYMPFPDCRACGHAYAAHSSLDASCRYCDSEGLCMCTRYRELPR